MKELLLWALAALVLKAAFTKGRKKGLVPTRLIDPKLDKDQNPQNISTKSTNAQQDKPHNRIANSSIDNPTVTKPTGKPRTQAKSSRKPSIKTKAVAPQEPSKTSKRSSKPRARTKTSQPANASNNPETKDQV
jgi:hypothetical protein